MLLELHLPIAPPNLLIKKTAFGRCSQEPIDNIPRHIAVTALIASGKHNQQGLAIGIVVDSSDSRRNNINHTLHFMVSTANVGVSRQQARRGGSNPLPGTNLRQAQIPNLRTMKKTASHSIYVRQKPAAFQNEMLENWQTGGQQGVNRRPKWVSVWPPSPSPNRLPS